MVKLAKEQVWQFIDATLNDHANAELMLAENPQLVNARWVRGQTVLHHLAVNYNFDAVKFLLEHGAAVDETNECGNTALLEVCTLGNEQIAELLLEHGANPNAFSGSFDTALICAVKAAKPSLVSMLLEAGADPAQRSPVGITIFDVMPHRSDLRLAIYRAIEKYAPPQIRVKGDLYRAKADPPLA